MHLLTRADCFVYLRQSKSVSLFVTLSLPLFCASPNASGLLRKFQKTQCCPPCQNYFFAPYTILSNSHPTNLRSWRSSVIRDYTVDDITLWPIYKYIYTQLCVSFVSLRFFLSVYLVSLRFDRKSLRFHFISFAFALRFDIVFIPLRLSTETLTPLYNRSVKMGKIAKNMT